MDDSFLKLSPEQQAATIDEIVAQSKQTHHSPAPAPHAAPAPSSATASPTGAPSVITPPLQDAFPGSSPVPGVDPTGGGAANHFNDKWLAQQEAAYQASLKSSPSGDPRADFTPPAPDKTSALGAAGLGALDSLSFGMDDEIGSALGTLIPGVGKKSVWDGSSFTDAYGSNVDAYRAEKDAAWNEHPYAYLGGGLASAFVPWGAASKVVSGGRGIAKAITGAEEATRLATKAKLLKAAKDGAIAGAAYGFGSDTGGIEDRLDGAALGGAAGALGGVGLQGAATLATKAANPVLDRLAPKLADARFAASQSGNPHVLTDAQVSDDLSKLVQAMTVRNANGKLSGKAQSRVLLDRVSDLERSYLPVEEIKALDLAPSIKARLKSAMAQRHLLSDGEVNALRDGTPAGDAVADGIAKARRLRAYVADVTGEGSRSTGRLFAEAAGSAAGWKLGGPIGGAAGSVLGRLAVPSGAKDAATAAIDLATKARAFAKLPEVQAVREAGQGAGDGLSRIAADALDAPYLAKREAQRESERLAAEGRKVSIANARDNVKPSGGWRGLVYDRTGLLPSEQDAGALAALNDGAISPEQFHAFLNAPDKLMEGNAGNALVDRLAHMADTGRLPRDPKWTPPARSGVVPIVREGAWATLGDVPQSVQDDALQSFFAANPGKEASMQTVGGRLVVSADDTVGEAAVRNPAAYRATAEGNQRRVSDTLASVHANDGLNDADREILATAITTIGSTSSKAKAQEAATDALDRLSNDHRDYGRSVLSPLVAQVKR